MNRILLFIGFALPSLSLSAQVGINTDKPTNTLDVNGTTRVRELKEIKNL